MSKNETLTQIAIIFVLISFVLPASVPDVNDLYGRFTNRLEEVANFAESEFKKSTSNTLKKIYEMNAKILQEQIAERKNAADILKIGKAVPTSQEDGFKHIRQNNSPSESKSINITVKFLQPVEGEVKKEQSNPKKVDFKADKLEFQIPVDDDDLKLDMQLKDEHKSNEKAGCFRKREMYDQWLDSKALDQFIDEMSAPATRRRKGNCNCGCENCRSLTRLSSERASCSCNCEKCNKCKRNEMFNYSRKFHKRFRGKSKRDSLPFSYPTDDIYTKVLSMPYNPVISPDTTLEKLLRMNTEMPGGNNSFIEGVGSNRVLPAPSIYVSNQENFPKMYE